MNLSEKIQLHRQLKKTAVQKRHLLAQWKGVFLQSYRAAHKRLLQLSHTTSASESVTLPVYLEPFLDIVTLRGGSNLRSHFMMEVSPNCRPTDLYKARVQLPLSTNCTLRLPSSVSSDREQAAWHALGESLSVFSGSPSHWRSSAELVIDSTAFQALHCQAEQFLQSRVGDAVPLVKGTRAPLLSLSIESTHDLSRPLPFQCYYVVLTMQLPASKGTPTGMHRRCALPCDKRGGAVMETFCLGRAQKADVRSALKEAIQMGSRELENLLKDHHHVENSNLSEENTIKEIKETDSALPVDPVQMSHTPTSMYATPSPSKKSLMVQNEFKVPDVGLMIEAIERQCYSKVILECNQEARHFPLQRVKQLLDGDFGDVEIYTKISARVAGTDMRYTAVSHPATSAGNENTLASENLSVQQMQWWRRRGLLRGPLCLIVDVVCQLYRAVCNPTAPSAPLPVYPLLGVYQPLSRQGLDFILYAWFGSPPQIRCFDIQPHRERRHYVYKGQRYDTMIRAMLFYDVHGSRLLFAETHHWEMHKAVQRLHELAVELNIPRVDSYTLPWRHSENFPKRATHPAVWERAFRGLADNSFGELCRHKVVSFIELRCGSSSVKALSESTSAVPTSSSPVAPVSEHRTKVVRRDAGRLLRQWIRRQPSQLAALVSVLEGLGTLKMRVVQAGAGQSVLLGDGTLLTSEELCVAELHFRVKGCREKKAPQRKAEEPEKGRSADPTHSQQTAGKAFYFREFVQQRITTNEEDATSSRTRRGLLPGFVLLCERTLAAVYTALPHLANQLLPLSALLQAAAQANPLCAAVSSAHKLQGPTRHRHALPPFNPRFYYPPNLLGEVLQGTCGKYQCDYALQPLPLGVQSGMVGSTQAAGLKDSTGSSEVHPPLEEDALEEERATLVGRRAPQRVGLPPPPIFYARAHSTRVVMEALHQPLSDGDAKGLTFEELHAMQVVCRISVPSLLGRYRNAQSDASLPATRLLGTDAPSAGFVLGVGVGRTKREAWKAAAWEALQLNFPDLAKQLPWWREVCELEADPKQLALLGVSSAGLFWHFIPPSSTQSVVLPLPSNNSGSSGENTGTSTASSPPAKGSSATPTTGAPKRCVVHTSAHHFTCAVAGAEVGVRVPLDERIAAPDELLRVGYGSSPGEAFCAAAERLMQELKRRHHRWKDCCLSARAALLRAAEAEANPLEDPEKVEPPSTPLSVPFEHWSAVTHYNKSILHCQLTFLYLQLVGSGRLELRFLPAAVLRSASSTYRSLLAGACVLGAGNKVEGFTPATLWSSGAPDDVVAVWVHRTWYDGEPIAKDSRQSLVRVALRPLVLAPISILDSSADVVTTRQKQKEQHASVGTSSNAELMCRRSRLELLWSRLQRGAGLLESSLASADDRKARLAGRASEMACGVLKEERQALLAEFRMSQSVLHRRLLILLSCFRLSPSRRAELLLELVFGMPVQLHSYPLCAEQHTRLSHKDVGGTEEWVEGTLSEPPGSEWSHTTLQAPSTVPLIVQRGWGAKVSMRLPKLASPFPDPASPPYVWWPLCEVEAGGDKYRTNSRDAVNALVDTIHTFIHSTVLPSLTALQKSETGVVINFEEEA